MKSTPTHLFFKVCLEIIPHLDSQMVYSFQFSRKKIMYAFIDSYMPAKCHTHLFNLKFLTPIKSVFDKEYKI